MIVRSFIPALMLATAIVLLTLAACKLAIT
jgi:hypothetical protein